MLSNIVRRGPGLTLFFRVFSQAYLGKFCIWLMLMKFSWMVSRMYTFDQRCVNRPLARYAYLIYLPGWVLLSLIQRKKDGSSLYWSWELGRVFWWQVGENRPSKRNKIYKFLGYLADKLSRKYTIFLGKHFLLLQGIVNVYSSDLLAVVVFCIGVIVQTTAMKPSSIYGGRFVTGLGVGSTSMAVPLYNAEVSVTSNCFVKSWRSI